MKLDFLQFLELEVFTRFGARLDASIEAKIRRGRSLRELLKQERLVPLSPEQQLAWLTAYNAGLFDALEAAEAVARLAKLIDVFATPPLALTDGRDAWLAAVTQTMAMETTA